MRTLSDSESWKENAFTCAWVWWWCDATVSIRGAQRPVSGVQRFKKCTYYYCCHWQHVAVSVSIWWSMQCYVGRSIWGCWCANRFSMTHETLLILIIHHFHFLVCNDMILIFMAFYNPLNGGCETSSCDGKEPNLFSRAWWCVCCWNFCF